MSTVMRRPTRGRQGQSEGECRVEANARLTASTGVVLLVLFVVQVGTVVVSVKSHVTLHVVVGFLLVPPLLAKIVSVSVRFLGYYRHDPAYRRKGPPTPALRIMGPLLLAVTLVLFVSGIILVLAPTAFGGPRGVMFHVHDVSFYLWLLLVIGHLVGHRHDVRRLAAADWVRRTRSTVGRAALRQAVLLASLGAGLALALAFVGRAERYQATVNRMATVAHAPRAAAVLHGEGCQRHGPGERCLGSRPRAVPPAP